MASGSSGNCTLLSENNTHLLVDAGISARRIGQGLQALGLRLSDVTGVLLTHEHTDHTSGLKTLTSRYGLPVWAPEECAFAVRDRVPLELLHPFAAGEGMELGEFSVESVPTPHDTPVSVGYALRAGNRRAVVVTDLGEVTAQVALFLDGADFLLLEANHDVELLRMGPYPMFLKQRVLGPHGHLSNAACAQAVKTCVERGTRHVFLGHLSINNNLPQLAYETVREVLCKMGAELNGDVTLQVAPRAELSQVVNL